MGGWHSQDRVGYFLIPIQSGVNKVGITIYDELTDYASLKSALDENKKLQEEVAQLTEENNRLVSDQFELRRLRELYNLDQEYLQYERQQPESCQGLWRLIQVFRVDKGSADGVEVGSNVMAGGGLVGIVTDVGAHYATVRSIIDDSSRVSSMAVQSGDTCIVAGDLTLYEEGRLRITNIQKDADVKRRGSDRNLEHQFQVFARNSHWLRFPTSPWTVISLPVPVIWFRWFLSVIFRKC